MQGPLFTHRGTVQPRRARGIMLLLVLCASLAACASTAPPPPTAAAEIAVEMGALGVEVSNVRRADLPGARREAIVDSQGFDIPGIKVQGKPAGMIRVFKQEKDAKLREQVFGMLGRPGPETKLDYVTVAGKRELILDHRLPDDLAQRYISAFKSVP